MYEDTTMNNENECNFFNNFQCEPYEDSFEYQYETLFNKGQLIKNPEKEYISIKEENIYTNNNNVNIFSSINDSNNHISLVPRRSNSVTLRKQKNESFKIIRKSRSFRYKFKKK